MTLSPMGGYGAGESPCATFSPGLSIIEITFNGEHLCGPFLKNPS